MTTTPTTCPECGSALVRMAPDHAPDEPAARVGEGAPLYCPQCKSVRPQA